MNSVASVTENTRQDDLCSTGSSSRVRRPVLSTVDDITLLAQVVAGVVSPTMEVVFDTSKPGGQPFRVLDVTKVTELGFEARVGLPEGVGRLVEYERERLGQGRR